MLQRGNLLCHGSQDGVRGYTRTIVPYTRFKSQTSSSNCKQSTSPQFATIPDSRPNEKERKKNPHNIFFPIKLQNLLPTAYYTVPARNHQNRIPACSSLPALPSSRPPGLIQSGCCCPSSIIYFILLFSSSFFLPSLFLSLSFLTYFPLSQDAGSIAFTPCLPTRCEQLLTHPQSS
jgi:hypothetical protein